MRKLHRFNGMCRHYSTKPGMSVECDAGVDIRAHVGGPDLGWMCRMPCVPTRLSEDVVPCSLRELPTAEEVERDQAQMQKNLVSALNGACPTCGTVLRLRENDDVQIQYCPNGHVSMRSCKRIGEHLE